VFVYGNCNLTIENSTISNNHGEYAGGILNFQANAEALTVITNCTLYNNTGGYAGNIAVDRTVIVTNCTFAGGGDGISSIRSSAELYIKNSLLEDSAGGICIDMNGETVVDGGNNIVESQDSSYFTNGTNGCLVGEQADLWGTGLSTTPSLAENDATNGTQTLALSAGSVAIDAGSATAHGPAGNQVTPPTTDQRGVARSGSADIGAFEMN